MCRHRVNRALTNEKRRFYEYIQSCPAKYTIYLITKSKVLHIFTRQQSNNQLDNSWQNSFLQEKEESNMLLATFPDNSGRYVLFSLRLYILLKIIARSMDIWVWVCWAAKSICMLLCSSIYRTVIDRSMNTWIWVYSAVKSWPFQYPMLYTTQ